MDEPDIDGDHRWAVYAWQAHVFMAPSPAGLPVPALCGEQVPEGAKVVPHLGHQRIATEQKRVCPRCRDIVTGVRVDAPTPEIVREYAEFDAYAAQHRQRWDAYESHNRVARQLRRADRFDRAERALNWTPDLLFGSIGQPGTGKRR
ncbi:MAG: hypothetical protein ACRDJ2_14005 [Actinomycetota bacterium]